MPIDYRRYSPDWKTIVQQIKARAGDRCEFCGVKNYAVGMRLRGEFVELVSEFDKLACRTLPQDERCIRIVLTVAHLDHDVDNNDPANLRALCQQCHLRWDAKHHARNAAETRRRKKIAVGQLEIA